MNVYDTLTKPIAIQLYLHITNFYVSIFSKILFKHIFTPLLSQMSDVKIDNRNTELCWWSRVCLQIEWIVTCFHQVII